MSSQAWPPRAVIRQNGVDVLRKPFLGTQQYIPCARVIASTSPELLRVDATDKNSFPLAIFFAGALLVEGGDSGPKQALVTMRDDSMKPAGINLSDIRAANYASLPADQQQTIWRALGISSLSDVTYHEPGGDYMSLVEMPLAGNIGAAAARAYRPDLFPA